MGVQGNRVQLTRWGGQIATRLSRRGPTRADPALVKALARAFRYQRLLEEGRYASISEMPAAERINRGYLLQLTPLAPDIVEAILDGRQPAELGLPALMGPFPLEWDTQRTALAVSA